MAKLDRDGEKSEEKRERMMNARSTARIPPRGVKISDPWQNMEGFASAVRRGVHMRLCVAPDGHTAPISKIHNFIKSGDLEADMARLYGQEGAIEPV